jgi:hypothetical protein
MQVDTTARGREFAKFLQAGDSPAQRDAVAPSLDRLLPGRKIQFRKGKRPPHGRRPCNGRFLRHDRSETVNSCQIREIRA